MGIGEEKDEEDENKMEEQFPSPLPFPLQAANFSDEKKNAIFVSDFWSGSMGLDEIGPFFISLLGFPLIPLSLVAIYHLVIMVWACEIYVERRPFGHLSCATSR